MITLLTSLALLASSPQEPDGALPSELVPRSVESVQAVGARPMGDLDQDQGALPLTPVEFDPLREPLFGEHEDGTWVRTRTYKARFAATGATFIPFLGAGAERNHPLGLRLASATVGGHPLPLARGGRVSRSGHVMAIDRGPVNVVYEVRQEGVEQLFTFDQPLLERGDLVLTLDLETDLVGRPMEGGFLFEGPEGGVRYGAAVAVDGEGRRLGVAAALLEGQIQISVPAWFIERAGGELIVDPIIDTWITSDLTGRDSIHPDIAYDRSTNTFCTVYELPFSGGDSDIFAGIADGMGNIITTIPVDTGGADIRSPQVAGLGATDQFLIVGERFDGPGGRHEIVGRIHSRQTGSTGPLLTIAGTGLFTTWTNARPDVGGNSSTAAGTVFAVVYEREFLTGSLAGTTAGRVTTVSPDGSIGSTRTIETEAGATLSEFAISKSASDPLTVNIWNVAYIRNRPGQRAQIRGVQLNPDGTMASAPNQLLELFSGAEPTGVDVSDGLPISSVSSQYLVVYDVPGTIGASVVVIVCRDNGLRDLFNLRDKDGGSSMRRRRGPSVTITYEEYIVAYHEQQADMTWRARITNLDRVGGTDLAAAEARVSAGAAYADPVGKVALASLATGGVLSRRTGLAYSRRHPTAARNIVVSGVFEASSPYSPAGQYCMTTTNSDGENGFLRFFGSRSASTTKTATATDLSPLQFALLVVGTGTDFVAGVGGGEGNLCIGGTIGRYNDQINQIDGGGTVSFTVNPSQIPQGGSLVSAVAGDTYYFQVWHRDTGAGGAPTSNLSNAAELRFN